MKTPILDEIIPSQVRSEFNHRLFINFGTGKVIEIPTDLTLDEVKARTVAIPGSVITIGDYHFIGFRKPNWSGFAFYYNPERRVYLANESLISLIDKRSLLKYMLREF